MGEEQINTVAVFRRNVIEIDAHQVPKAVIPRHDIEVRFLDAGGFRHQGVEKTTGAFADPLAADRLGRFARWQTCQQEEVAGFGRGALQRLRHRRHHRD